MANSADPDQLASPLFAKAGYIRVQHDKGINIGDNFYNLVFVDSSLLE